MMTKCPIAVKSVFCLVFILAMLGVSGCMSSINEDLSVNQMDSGLVGEQIALQLAQKYDGVFHVINVDMEFNGREGMYYRALCNSQDYDDTFTVYCYESKDGAPDAFSIGDHAFVMQDQYAEVLLQNYLLRQLGDYDTQTVFVGCKVCYDGEQPSVQMLKDGMDACLQNADAYLKFYFVSDGADVQALQEKAAQLIANSDPYRGYIYVAQKHPFVAAEIAEVFAENQHDYGNFLNNTDYADRVDFTLYRMGEGFQPTETIKE